MEGQKGREDFEEDVNSYWMILRHWENTGIWSGKAVDWNLQKTRLEEMWTYRKAEYAMNEYGF